MNDEEYYAVPLPELSMGEAEVEMSGPPVVIAKSVLDFMFGNTVVYFQGLKEQMGGIVGMGVVEEGNRSMYQQNPEELQALKESADQVVGIDGSKE